ncbi:MAG: hypothetical protein GF400_11245 [Candidatus Eisenbacteria bacterium]|nr:hypothetical protein [Candidatus Eisenbacteria bacterium]
MLRTSAMRATGTIVLLLSLCPSAALSVSTDFWTVDSFRSMATGRPDGASVTHDGTIVCAPTFERSVVEGLDYVWAASLADGGPVYAVCGTPGRLVRLEGEDAAVLAEDESADFPALAVSPAGDVYVGSAPGGLVYRLSEEPELAAFFDSRQGYVWSMAYSPEHGLAVGTGDSACVFVVGEGGSEERVYASSQASVTALAAVDGRIIAGTSPGGLLLDVTPGSEPRALFDSAYEEITGIAADGAGRVVFSGTTISYDDVLSPGEEFGQSFGEGSVYALTPAGGAVELWYSDDAPITALGTGVDGRIWFGTGDRGRVYSIDDVGKVDVVTELADDQVLSIAGGAEGAVVTTGLGAAVYVVSRSPAAAGAYESDILDAGAAAFWGEMSWEAERPAGTSLAVSTRSGNTGSPDQSWSEWTEVGPAGEGRVRSPSARFLQWKAVLTSAGGRSPVLRGARVAYRTENLPPRVGQVTVYEPGEVNTTGNGVDGAASQTLPSGVEVTYSLSGGSRDRYGVPTLLRGVRTAEWSAADPNGDLLEFDLWIRSDDEEEWKLLAEELTRTVHTWDTASMPDGRYRIRVVASDGPANPPESRARGEADSGPFVVDNESPVLEGLELDYDSGTLVVRGDATDRLSQLSGVEVAIDYGEWQWAHARDGSYDSRGERFEVALEVEGEREHSVAVRAVDRAGNVTVVRRVLR